MDLPKVKEDILKEFDRIYIHENAWKSEDESHAFAPVEGMRQFIWDSLDKYALAILKEVRGLKKNKNGHKQYFGTEPYSDKGYNSALTDIASFIRASIKK